MSKRPKLVNTEKAGGSERPRAVISNDKVTPTVCLLARTSTCVRLKRAWLPACHSVTRGRGVGVEYFFL